MRIWMFDRSNRKFIPFVCKTSQVKGRTYLVWGRFRIRVFGKIGRQIFEDQYEIKKAGVSIRSRNNIVLVNDKGDDTDKEHLVAFHLVLPDDFKGKCIKAASGKRIFYDYKKKGDSPPGFFSVMALVHIPENEVVVVYDSLDKVVFKTAIGNTEGILECLSNKKA